MSVFPYAPRDLAVELFVAGGWTDITSDVYVRDRIRITRGLPNLSGMVPPSSCSLTLNNRSGKYARRNPTGPYYGTLGRNTPLRVAIRTAKDSFPRTVASSWSTADVGGTWSTLGGSASDYNVAAGVGTHSVSAAGAARMTYLGGQLYRSVDVAVTVSVPFSDVLTAAIEPACIVLSGVSTTNYLQVTMSVSAAEVVSLSVVYVDGTVYAGPTVVSGLTFTGQALRVRAQLDGQTIRAKAWAASAAEPYAWTVEAGATSLGTRLSGRAAGWVGVRSGVAAGNTNTTPVVFSYDSFELRSNRFIGEVAHWPTEWDPSGEDVYTPITAAGILRRLGQGDAPTKSTYLRGNQTITPPPVAYWPIEDGSTSTEIASGLDGGTAMKVNGPAQFATNTDFVGSAPIAKPNHSQWVGTFPPVAATGQIQMLFLLTVPSTGETDQAALVQLQMSGTAGFLDVVYQVGSGGFIRLKFYDQARALTHTSPALTLSFDGRPVQLSIELTQTGGDIVYAAATLGPGDAFGLVVGSTFTAATFGAPVGVILSPYREVGSSAIGHFSVRTSITAIGTLADQLRAYATKSAEARISRLCDENAIPYAYRWDGIIPSASMGAQARDSVTALINEAATADQGGLYESRNSIGLGYRTRSGFYNQDATLALDYSLGQLQPPFSPVDDDSGLRNDVTVTRKNGSSYQAVQETGPLAVTAPGDTTGVGRYDTSETLNLAYDSQVLEAATWKLHLGTTDESRYPTIKINLAHLAARWSEQLSLDALAVDVDHRITIANPKSGLEPGTIAQLVRGYTEELNGMEHSLTFNCSPASPYDVLVLDSTTKGKVDSTTSTLMRAAGASDTSLYVVDSAFSGWTSDAAQMPIPITVAGETMSVTAVSTLGTTFVAAGVADEGSNASRTPALPAGTQAGDLLLVLAAIRNSGAGTVNIPAGYTFLADGSNFRLFGKIHTGVESAPTVSFTGGVVNATCHAQMAAFRGASLTVLNAAGQLNSSAQNIAYPAMGLTVPLGVVLYLGWKQDDWTSVATLSGATEIGEVSTITGDDAGFVWDYQIQGAAPVNIASGSFVVTGGASAISRGITLALAGNVQKFTVTRSTNGISKAQAAGASVRLTRPATIAL